MLDKFKQIYEMQKRARELKAQLENVRVEKTSPDGLLKATINGTQKFEHLSIDPSYLTPDKKQALERALKDLINASVEDIQKQAAAQAAGLMKDLQGLKLPGM